MKTLSSLLAAGFALGSVAPGAAPTAPSYVRELQQWRSTREEKLKAPTSWLAVAGLFWLKEGENSVGSDPASDVVLPARAPKHAGTLIRHELKAGWKPASGAVAWLDADSPPAAIGSVTLALIEIGRASCRERV